MKFPTLMRSTLLAAAATLIAVTASAHHSTAMFEWGKEKTLEGIIDKWEWTQPHTFLWIDVKGENGKVQHWGFEGMSPSWLGRRGWNSRTLKQGDALKVVYYPLRDGRKGGFYVRVILPDGRKIEAMPQRSS